MRNLSNDEGLRNHAENLATSCHYGVRELSHQPLTPAAEYQTCAATGQCFAHVMGRLYISRPEASAGAAKNTHSLDHWGSFLNRAAAATTAQVPSRTTKGKNPINQDA